MTENASAAIFIAGQNEWKPDAGWCIISGGGSCELVNSWMSLGGQEGGIPDGGPCWNQSNIIMLADRLPHCIVYGVSCKSPRGGLLFFLPSDEAPKYQLPATVTSVQSIERLKSWPGSWAVDRTAVRTFGELPGSQLFQGNQHPKLAIGRDSRHCRRSI
jgi:hypothetical protein